MKTSTNNAAESPRHALLQLLPGIAPLFLYIIVDAIFGERIGIIAAVVLGIAEFILIIIKERRSDLFVLADTGLLVALGLLSLALDSPLMVKAKPALFEFIAAALFAFLAFLPQQKSTAFIRRILRAKDLPLVIPRKIALLFAALSALHALAVLSAAAFLTDFWWITATTSYYFLPLVVLAPLLAFKFLRPLFIRLRYKDDEWFDIVTPEGKLTGRMPRTLCHRGPGLLHPVVHLFVFDAKRRILLQKRSMNKAIQPGKWDTSVGGHVMAGEEIVAALFREAHEELGITKFKPQFLYRYVWEYEIESELVFAFATEYRGDFKFNSDEIDEIRFFTIKQIESGEVDVTPNLRHEITLIRKYADPSQRR